MYKLYMIFFVKLAHFESVEEIYNMIIYIGVKQYSRIASAIAKFKRKKINGHFFQTYSALVCIWYTKNYK